jgi:hypothetical protein
MNQTTFGLLMSTSDATGRPLLTSGFQGQPSMTLFSSPIVIASQFPDLAPGRCRSDLAIGALLAQSSIEAARRSWSIPSPAIARSSVLGKGSAALRLAAMRRVYFAFTEARR